MSSLKNLAFRTAVTHNLQLPSVPNWQSLCRKNKSNIKKKHKVLRQITVSNYCTCLKHLAVAAHPVHVPVIPTIPFLLNTPQAFCNSLLFPRPRSVPESGCGLLSALPRRTFLGIPRHPLTSSFDAVSRPAFLPPS